MNEHEKLRRLLEMLIFLSSGLRYTKDEIIQRFNLSERSFYRYIRTFRNAGFIILVPKEGRYFIDKKSPYFKEIDELLHFSKEEAYILQQAIHSISNVNLLKQNLIEKLYALYNSERVADTITKMEHSKNIHEITKAIKQKKRVLLIGYQSANSNAKKDRVVEPFKFTSNFIATWAYDVESNCCKIFKNTRSASVKILKENWNHEPFHVALPMDVFRISSKEQTEVKLKLSVRASELLKEEYPLAEQFITVDPHDDCVFTAPVCGFEGVGRFVIGLCNDVEVVYPRELKDFIKTKVKNILTDSSWQ
ncbi:helix-turn-helix transcriptional regulator [Saccharicrinis sp. 156]|uniref:helix-turn-helix transcriptional regulator n=1 Tax=Saccharicrinis sp. 156 TaxID=3417574 RepID=UPI003D34755E